MSMIPRAPRTSRILPKSKNRMRLAILSVIVAIGIYSYFAYSKELFPFTKENKAKINKLLKGKNVSDDSAIDDILAEEEGLVNELGTPSGGTGALGFDDAGSLNQPRAKGIESLYQQGLYRQLFEPFDRGGGGGSEDAGASDFSPITVGGDVPTQSVARSLPQPYRYPFPVDERLNDMYGLFPPGGSFGDRYDPYSPIYSGFGSSGSSGSGNYSNKPPINPAVFNCNNCGPGMSWDNCTCRCMPEDSPRLMCFRPECACPDDGGSGGPGRDWWRGGRGPRDGSHEYNDTASCPPGYMFDSCRCKCVSPGSPEIQCIRNCTECPEGQWYSFCSNRCVTGKQKQCAPEVFEYDVPIPDIPDIPDWIPDEALADIGQLRDLRDKLLQEIDELREELQDEIDELNERIEEERQRREELEDLVEEIQEEMEEEETNNVPREERIRNNESRSVAVADAQQAVAEAVAGITQSRAEASTTQTQINSNITKVNTVNSRLQIHATAKSGSGSGSSSGSGSGSTTATAGGGSATACAGGRCITAGQAKVRAFRSMEARQERNFAFAKLQHKARRMNTLKAPPTAHLKNKQFMNILPPIVARRHFASRIIQS
jgi:hypothetical protein